METGLQFFGKTQKVIFRKVEYTTGTANSSGSGPVFVRVSGDTGFAGETGLYYYGARYLDPKVSRRLSADPAMGDYLPSAPVNDEARRRNGNLPGQGGVFNYVNLHAYHYAGNNPVKYLDPDGREIEIIGVEQNINGLIRQLENASGLKLDIAEGKIKITNNRVVQKLQFLNNNRLKTTKNMDFVKNPCFLGDL